MEIFHKGFEVKEKSNNPHYSEPVTIADTTASKLIVEALTEEFPHDGILSEEEPDNTELRLSRRRVWIIDPLDGTKGFTKMQGDFAVQIGLVENGKPILGVVYQPINKKLYYAIKDAGAFLENQNAKTVKLHVTNTTEFSEMTIAESRSHRSSRMQILNAHFNFKKELPHSSVGLKVGLLAEKRADIYIHLSPHTKFWDTAAPQIILEEAGGLMTDLFGENIKYDNADVRNLNGILCTNGIAHAKAVKRLRPLLTNFNRARINATS